MANDSHKIAEVDVMQMPQTKASAAIHLLARRKMINAIKDPERRALRLSLWQLDLEDYWKRYEQF